MIIIIIIVIVYAIGANNVTREIQDLTSRIYSMVDFSFTKYVFIRFICELNLSNIKNHSDLQI